MARSPCDFLVTPHLSKILVVSLDGASEQRAHLEVEQRGDVIYLIWRLIQLKLWVAEVCPRQYAQVAILQQELDHFSLTLAKCHVKQGPFPHVVKLLLIVTQVEILITLLKLVHHYFPVNDEVYVVTFVLFHDRLNGHHIVISYVVEDKFRHGVPLCTTKDFLHCFRLLLNRSPLNFWRHRLSFTFFILLHVDLYIFFYYSIFSLNTMCGPIRIELSIILGLFKPSGWILPRS